MNIVPKIPSGYQKCISCGVFKPHTKAYFDAHHADVLRSECKVCRKKSKKEYYYRNREEISAKTREYTRANRDKISQRSKKYYQENKERIIARVKKYRSENADKIREYRIKHHERDKARNREYYWTHHEERKAKQREYSRNNPEIKRRNFKMWAARNRNKLRIKAAKRRAIKKNAAGSHTTADIKLIYERQGGRCWYCQCDLNGEYHADHRIPLSRGGSNDASNIVVACPFCNLSKGDKLPHEWSDRLL